VASRANSIRETYEKRRAAFEAAFQQDDKLWRILSYARLGVFVGGAVISYFVLKAHFLGGIGVAGAFVVLLLLLVKKHAQVEARRSHNRHLKQVNEKELQALDRDYAAFGEGKAYLDPRHAFSYDLDLFGPRSIFQYLNRTASQLGETRLANWLQQPFLDKSEIQTRQQAIQDLAGRLDFRQEFQALGEAELSQQAETEKIESWLQEESFYLKHPIYPWLRYLLPLLLLALVIAFLFVPQVTWHVPVLMMAANLLVVRQSLNRVNRTHALLGRQFAVLDRYGDLLALVEKESFEAARLQSLQAQLKAQEMRASESIKDLASISRAFDQRFNIFAAFFLNAIILWDLLCMFRLEKWKEKARQELPEWFEVMAEFDALQSLGAFAYNHPDFCLPEIVEEASLMEGQGLGHILLDPENRVDNDLKLQGDGQYVIITGANMAGKSTFLRTVGTNLVLAMLGAPVCAQSLREKNGDCGGGGKMMWGCGNLGI
jgi:ABC-type multidrug transport system fused ATPase/permease subunit